MHYTHTNTHTLSHTHSKGQLEVAGHMLSGDDLKVTRTFTGDTENVEPMSYDQVYTSIYVDTYKYAHAYTYTHLHTHTHTHTHTYNMTHLHVRYDLLICVTRITHISVMIFDRD